MGTLYNGYDLIIMLQYKEQLIVVNLFIFNTDLIFSFALRK